MELHDRGDWTKFNLDTCVAQTTIPKSWKAIHRPPGSTVTSKTASGELIPMEGTGSYVGSNEKWIPMQDRATNANVDKPWYQPTGV